MINLSLVCHDKFVIIGIGGGWEGDGRGMGGMGGGNKKVSKKDEIHQKLIYWVCVQYNERDIY